MPQTSWALSEVQASIDACGTDIRAAELEISKVEEQLASPGLSSEDKTYWRKKEEQLRKEKEQLRKEKEQLRTKEEQLRTKEEQLRKEKEQLRTKEEQLRKKEELMLGRAERIEMQATSGACAVFAPTPTSLSIAR